MKKPNNVWIFSQNIWLFRSRHDGRLATDCIAKTRAELCEMASKRYGRTAKQWARHPDVVPVKAKLVVPAYKRK